MWRLDAEAPNAEAQKSVQSRSERELHDGERVQGTVAGLGRKPGRVLKEKRPCVTPRQHRRVPAGHSRNADEGIGFGRAALGCIFGRNPGPGADGGDPLRSGGQLTPPPPLPHRTSPFSTNAWLCSA